MREKLNHLYLDSHERILLLHSLVELKNQLIQQTLFSGAIQMSFAEKIALRNKEY